jgi:magnesium and cobalt transporter
MAGAISIEMSEDYPSTSGSAPKGWLERLSQALSGEPRNREELIEELRAAKQKGLLDSETLAMLEGAMSVAYKHARDIMVPRAKMVSIPISATFDDMLQIVVESGHSRYPLHGEDQDDIHGILLAKDLLKCVAARNLPCDARSLRRPVVLVPESKRLNILLRDFKANRQHMAVVVDEYGGVAGLVTIEDVLEEIVGEIDDEHDAEDRPIISIQSIADGVWTVEALTPILEFNQHFATRFSDEDSDTVGGLVTQALGHLPEQGDSIELDGWKFEVSQADNRRVHQLHVFVAEQA